MGGRVTGDQVASGRLSISQNDVSEVRVAIVPGDAGTRRSQRLMTCSALAALRARRHRRQARRRRAPRPSTTASALFECPDLLALGWLANREREKRHGARTYYNFNIRLEATNVCVASCLFCSFARLKPGDAGAYTMSLEQAWDKLRQRAAPAAHRSPRRQRPAPGSAVRLLHGDAARLQADPSGHPPEVLHRGRDRVLRRSLRHDRRAGAARAAGGRPRFAARRRRGDLRRARAAEDLPRQVRHRSLPRDPPHRAPARHALERHDALRAHRDDRRSASITCCAPARCRTRPAGSRRSSRSRSIPTTTRCGSCRRRARPTRCACTPSRG